MSVSLDFLRQGVAAHGDDANLFLARWRDEVVALIDEVERLRKALERIANEGHANPPYGFIAVARAALGGGEGTP